MHIQAIDKGSGFVGRAAAYENLPRFAIARGAGQGGNGARDVGSGAGREGNIDRIEHHCPPTVAGRLERTCRYDHFPDGRAIFFQTRLHRHRAALKVDGLPEGVAAEVRNEQGVGAPFVGNKMEIPVPVRGNAVVGAL